MFEVLTLSDDRKQRCREMIGMIEKELPEWKRRYAACKPAFQGLNDKPVFTFIDEIVPILQRIRDSLEQNGAIGIREIKDLHAWVKSGKPKVLRTFTDTLQKIYPYTKSLLALEGKDIDKEFVDLDLGHLNSVINVPRHIPVFTEELLSNLQKDFPALAKEFSEFKGQTHAR